MVTAMARPSASQTVDDLELLPPVGTTTPATTEIEELEEVIEAEPVVVEGYDGGFWQPSQWFNGPIWSFGTELGINGSEGNAQAFSILAGGTIKRETDLHTLEWDVKYGKTQTGGIKTQHFALSNSRWDVKLDSIWQLYNKNVFEFDEFKAFDVRLVLSGGLTRNVIKTDLTTFSGRFGAGASREYGGGDEEWVPEANFGIDFEHQLTKKQKLKLVTDYYPAWEEVNDFRLVADAHWEIMIDEASNLSLKLGAIDRYDSTPNGPRTERHRLLCHATLEALTHRRMPTSTTGNRRSTMLRSTSIR